jgi:hypothetical protein
MVRKKVVTERKAIIRRLADILKINISVQEQNSKAGFHKIVKMIKEKGWTNAHLNGYKIDLVSFEKLCHEYGCYRFLFSGKQKLLNALQKFQAFQS